MKTYRAVRQPTVNNVLRNLVELCQYLPCDYIQSSFLMTLKDRLSELWNNFTREKYDSSFLRLAISLFI